MPLLNDLAGVEHEQGDYTAAERDHSEALRIAKAIDYREGVAIYTGNLAELRLDREDWVAAERLAIEALELAEKVGRQELIGSDCHRLAKALARQGRPEEGLPYARGRSRFLHACGSRTTWKKARAVLEECGG